MALFRSRTAPASGLSTSARRRGGDARVDSSSPFPLLLSSPFSPPGGEQRNQRGKSPSVRCLAAGASPGGLEAHARRGKGRRVADGSLLACQGVVANVEAQVWLTGADARRQVRVKRERVGRSLGAAPWLGVHAMGAVGACPLPGVARTRTCTLRWCGDAAKRLRPGGRKERGRGRHTGPPVSEGKEREGQRALLGCGARHHLAALGWKGWAAQMVMVNVWPGSEG
jgi:hypothetical protein